LSFFVALIVSLIGILSIVYYCVDNLLINISMTVAHNHYRNATR
jgi:hypothetical protein